MELSFLLPIHIIGAALLALLLITTVGTLYRPSKNMSIYKGLAIAVALATSFEIATGSAMFVIATDANVVSFCGKMAIYISLSAIAEFALIQKLRSPLVAKS